MSRVRRAAWRRWARARFLVTERRRTDRVVVERVAGRPLVVLPGVFNPAVLRSGEFLATALDQRLVPPGSRVLEIGTGSGVAAVTVAAWASAVVAVDINPQAVRTARINALLRGVEDVVEVREGDLFAPVQGERFDVIISNPPYLPGTPRDGPDRAFRAGDVLERLAAGIPAHLADGGCALLVTSTDGVGAALVAALEAEGMTCAAVARRDLGYEVLTLTRCTRS